MRMVIITMCNMRYMRMRQTSAKPTVRATLRFCIFFSRLNLITKRPSFLLVGEGETSHTVFELEGVEEGSVVVIFEPLVELLVPENAFVALLISLEWGSDVGVEHVR